MTDPLKLKIIACGVFEDELSAVANSSPNHVEIELLDAGLHAVPDQLRLRSQEAIDAASRQGGYDGVCFAYGLCGRGTAGLIARDVPLVLPRVHDCISLFLGSAQAYYEQFAAHPGTFYFTTGWYNKKAHPEHTRMAAARRFDPATHRHFGEFCARYGEDNARYIIEFLESWRKNYRRAALIDHGFVTAEHQETTRLLAEAAGWDYERLEGSLALLEDMAAGRWDEERFLVVAPGRMVVPTNDERIYAAVPAAQEGAGYAGLDAAARVEVGSFLYGERTTSLKDAADVGLGIDAGGTYTDAVLYEFSTGRLLSKAKSITTHHNLVEGIAESLGKVDAALFDRVSYVALSTTLATNAIVEGRGQPVGLLLMPYHESGTQGIRTPLYRVLSARTTIQGTVEAGVDEEEVLQAARHLVREGAASFAVSGYGSVRNPEHELQVKRILRREFELPVVCGHELSARLNFVARAHTAVLNARLIPLIEHLLESVEEVLKGAGIRAPVFVVRGDGSIMRKEVARMRAVETVLSGPAASAAGGRLLTGCRDALVIDMGGTTTDVAALRDGRLSLSAEGARVGHWRTSVTAADIQTTGLGGDSAVRPAGTGRFDIGPGRVIPLSFLAARWPHVREELAQLSAAMAQRETTPEVLDFFVLAGKRKGLALKGEEARIVELLAERPHSRLALANACGCLAPQLLRVRRLEDTGLVRRSGVTPTDAMHVLGTYTPHDVEAARLGISIMGHFAGLEEGPAADAIVEAVERLLALSIMRRELATEAEAQEAERFEAARPLLERALCADGQATFHLHWRQLRPVVGIGAPVAAFLPGACRRLGIEPVVPPDADVANAVGAVTSQVFVSECVRVRPGEFGRYVMFAPDGRQEFAALEKAERAARARVVELVRRRAAGFGTQESQVSVEVSRRVGRVQDGSTQLLEVEVRGILEGAPTVAAR
jgi:N-methylhydantoinase A/oxoprolinase/acetone carboxylase beta subunit